MNARQLTSHLSVSPQLSIADIATAKAQGFRAVIVNRPDGEEAGQPTLAEMEDAARAAGMGFAAIPVIPGQATMVDAGKFADALRTLDGPAIAYCRTGVRASTLWALSVGSTLEPSAILERTATAGYDLGALQPRLEALYEGSHADASSSPHNRGGDVS